MLLVKTYLSISSINGIGLFAGENIKKGTHIWAYNETTTQAFWKRQFVSVCNQLSLESIHDVLKYSYLRDGNVYYLNDNSRFINHSEDPNIAFKNTQSIYSIKNIKRDC